MSGSVNDDIYRLLLQHITDGIIVTNKQGDIIFVNSAAEKIRNLSKNDIMGHNVINCHKDNSKNKVNRAIEFLATHKDQSFKRMVTDVENNKIYENVYTAIFSDEKDMVGMAVISKDITEKRRVDEEKANLARSQAINFEMLKAEYNNLLLSSMEMLANIMESRDEYTDGHSKRVSDIVTKLYEYRYGINQEYLDIKWAAKLHDIGKLCINDQIINKPGKLTKEEYEVVKCHSRMAGQILKNVDRSNRIIPSVTHHHERFDGKGYPDGLKGNDIPEGARIIAVADTFDAMRSCRPYRNSLSYEYCVKEIRTNAGSQFDPEWVEVFLELAGTGSID